MIDGVLYPLWDIGLKVGHAVRSVDDCVSVANSDMQSKTSLIESRLITGNEKLFANSKNCREQMRRRLRGKIHRDAAGGPGDAAREVRQFRLHAGAEHQERLRRPARFSKSSVDGIFQVSHAVAARTAGSSEFLNEAERKQLEAAYDFLLRVRTELHYHTNRPVDVLGKNLQPAVAHNLGYGDRSPSQRIEKFMRDLYTHMRNIYLITRTLEQRMALLSPPQTSRLRPAAAAAARRGAAQDARAGGRIRSWTAKSAR